MVIVLRLFFSMLQTYLCGSRKPQNVFCVHSELHISHVSKLLDPLNLTSHLIKFEILVNISLCFYAQNKPNKLQNLFHAVLNNPINQKNYPEEKNNLRQLKIGGRGVWGKYDRCQIFNVF